MKAVWGNTSNPVLKTFAAMFVAALLTAAGAAHVSAAVGVTDRESDPVVLTGMQTSLLVGAAPEEIVAFRWDGSWRQVPVQVDERKLVDYRILRRLRTNGGSSVPKFFSGLVYADANTYAGADGSPQRQPVVAGDPFGPDPSNQLSNGDPKFDEDDEIVFMAKDAGVSAVRQSAPAGVVESSRTPVRISDPVNPGTNRFVYLFRSTSGLDPAAGTDYVSYDLAYVPELGGGYFGVDNGLSGYDFGSIGDNVNGPPVNPESSTVSTDLYELTFPGRWMVDGLKLKTGAVTADILDGDKSTVGVTGCGRNELTFSRGGGGVIAAIDGPVRAIRSYIGANSGTYTQRDQVYYQGRSEVRTFLRVHPGITDFVTAMDYSEGAFGMQYRNSLNEAGVTIDGRADQSVKPGALQWEQVSGDQGSLSMMTRVDTDVINPTFTSFYEDDMTPSANSSMLCSGDDHAIGASGPRIITPFPDRDGAQDGPNTDPTLAGEWGDLRKLEATRYSFYGAPNEPAATAKLRSAQVDSPLVLATGAGIDGETGVPSQPDPVKPGTPVRQNWVGLKISVKPASLKLRPGRSVTAKVKVRNIGDKPAFKVRICPSGKESLVKTGRCKTVRKLKAGRSVSRAFKVRLRKSAAGVDAVPVRFWAKASRSKARSAFLMLRPAGR